MRFASHFLFAAAALAALPGVVQAQSPANPAPAAAQGGTYKVESSHTRVNFTVNHFGFTDWYGDFANATGTLELNPKAIGTSKVDITIPVASVSTTNAKLDEELKSPMFLDAAKYPEIHFVSKQVVRTGPRTARILGELSFHGVTRPVVLEASFNAGGVNPMDKAYTLGFNATAKFKRSDFGVKTYVPVVSDEVTLRISAAFEKQN
ncbi:MAG TPA: YceI family protein [Novosphingobium sp.]|nr:YceI family protein [Novosphingobium sp.]